MTGGIPYRPDVVTERKKKERTCARVLAESERKKPQEEEEDAAYRETERECPGGTGYAQNGNEEKAQVNSDAEKSLQRRAQGRPVTGENSKPQCEDSGARDVASSGTCPHSELY
ncbi:hypothetical protein NDU88_003592 [Pleurodeles waltl]|uniref:Uncharacterized protein n=1 Tax=Pleurodeles waltl TaxID=8319 RepID=A0AAV7T5X0_PLEWA|nr:hypothetical protein NDU88_003592 [Pleurodeles waltl]